jgi:hypothetical protein
MSDKPEKFRGESYRRQRSREMRAPAFTVPPFPETSRVSIKQIAFLHVHCQESPRDIAARFPKFLTLADVHAALSIYFRNPEPVDAEIRKEVAFNRGDALNTAAVALPRVRLASLVEVED